MARAFDSNMRALLRGESLVRRDLLVITFPEGSYGYWSDIYAVQFPEVWPGVTFTGAGSLIELSGITQSVSDTVQTLTGTLSGLASDVLATVGQYNLHQAKVQAARALYDPATRQLASVKVVFRGYIDRDETRESDGEAQLVIECVSRARELDRATNRKRTHTDQSRTFPGDRGFEFTTKTATTPLVLGR